MQIRKRSKIRRQQIIDIIRNSIFSKGIEHINISKIASRTGTSETAIYRHFKSKWYILGFLIDNIEETLMEALDKAMISDDLIQNLRNVLFAHLMYPNEQHETSFVVITVIMQSCDVALQC